jgi:dCTP deaminase
MTQAEETLFGESGAAEGGEGRHSTGILPSHVLRRLIRARREVVAAEDIEDAQIQPASLDLRLGAWPGGCARVSCRAARQCATSSPPSRCTRSISPKARCWRPAASMSCRCWKAWSFRRACPASPIPKARPGRLDVFTRLITDRAPGFDRIEPGYRGPLYAEISPRTFPVLVRKGSRLNQLRVRHGSPQFTDTQLKRLHAEQPLVDGPADIDNGLALSVDLKGDSPASRSAGGPSAIPGSSISTRGARRARLLGADLCQPVGNHRARSRRVLHPGVPGGRGDSAGFRRRDGAVQSAGGRIPGPLRRLLRSRFRHEAGRGRGARAVLEVRSREVPFIIEHGQIIGRLVFERLTDPPPEVYGQGIGSNYQRQGLKLSKHFRQT